MSTLFAGVYLPMQSILYQIRRQFFINNLFTGISQEKDL